MSALIPRLIIIGLAASVSPVAVMILISVLARKHARRNSLIFLLGFTVTLIALGAVMVYIFHLGGSGGTSKLDSYIDLSLGALCLLAIPLDIKRQSKRGEPKVESDMKPLRSFTLGSISMLINTSTIIIFISGLHVISAASLGLLDSLLAIVVLTIFSLITLLIPIVIYFVFPQKSEKLLNSLRAWLSKHSKEIGIVILLIFGVYLMIKGGRVVF